MKRSLLVPRLMTNSYPAETGTVVMRNGDAWERFRRPLEIVAAKRPSEVLSALEAVDRATQHAGLYAAGFIAYEAATGLGLVTNYNKPDSQLLLWFGLYDRPEPFEAPTIDKAKPISLSWQPAVGRGNYLRAIRRIKRQIAEGYTYQVNFTFPLIAAFDDDAWALFAAMVRAQQAPYAAFVDTGRLQICSASPELFFHLEGNRLTSKPMKGTAPRGRFLAEDRRLATELFDSEKNRAENVMIVDMIRNDMGRVASMGSVRVPELFTVETYPTLHQMTSTVTAATAASLTDIVTTMFPCASITGAPKHSTMQIIRDLESTPRGVYTGAVGVIGPQREALFNVAIRTVVVDKDKQRATYGVGSGIVWDSDAESEYGECLLKARVLGGDRATTTTWAHRAFELLESLLWEPNQGYFLLEEHLHRLSESATFFGIPFDPGEMRATLTALGESLATRCKVRAMVSRDGHMRFESHVLSDEVLSGGKVQLGLAKKAIQSDTIWLYHKTTERDLYDSARNSRPECDDVLLWNERQEVTETTTANVVVDLDGVLCTPPQSSGLLAGTFRARLLREGRLDERIIPVADLSLCRHIYLINSVRKWREARLVPNMVTQE